MNLHYTSPSSLETFKLCPKKWYALKVLKIPEPPKDYLAFGTATHAVCERFLLADDLGHVPHAVDEAGAVGVIEYGALVGQYCGQPVNLYPEGWHIVKERDGGTIVLTNEQQNLIRILIDKAFEEGKLVRWPDRKVERRFGFSDQEPIQLIPGINVCGVIDVDLPGSVRDWKTAKNMRYAKSAKKLLTDWQMGIYAGVKIIDATRAGGAIPTEIDVYHTVFSKDPDNQVIRETKATLTRAHIDRVWQEITIEARKMAVVLNCGDFWKAGEPSEGACGAYGGCCRLPVCNGGVSLENHKQQIELVLRNHVAQTTPVQTFTTPTLTQNPMGILSQGTGASPAPTNIPPAATAPATLNPPAVAQMPPGNASPWAFPGCTACGTGTHPGLNTQGEPCRICDGNQGQAGGITSAMYVITPDGQGGVSYQAKPEYQAALQGLGAPLSGLVHKMVSAAIVQTQEAPAQPTAFPAAAVPPQPRPTITPVAQPVAQAAPPAQPAPVAEASPSKEKDKTFVLYVNTTSTKFATSRKVVDLNVLFSKYAHMLATEKQVESYYKMEVWSRRDAMAAVAAFVIKEEFPSNALVAAVASDPDITSFISALRPLAAEVIEAKVV